PAADWAFGDCSSTPFPGTLTKLQLCLKGGFQPDFIYEFIYTAKDPLILGLGLAATRDLVSFFRYNETDDAGAPNPLAGAITAAIGEGQSQAGRFLRTFLDLGFNQDEYRNLVFDGATPHIAGQGIPVNVRFGQPDRASGQRENALYPSPDSPPTWAPTLDPLARRLAGNADACRETLSCPKIFHTVSSTEFWQGRMSLNITDALGQRDVALPDFVRLYHFASTQHTPTTSNSTGMCQQLQNPAPFFELRRALLIALERWVLTGVEPPPSRYPTLAAGTLVPPDAKSVNWPALPGIRYNGLLSTMYVRDYGAEFDARRLSGIISQEPPRVGAPYTMLVPKLDADGNELGGLRSPSIQAPRGTHTGWALRRAGFGENELCGLTGSYIPFRATRADRLAANDPRPSIEERYPTPAAYAAAVETAANELLKAGYLLPEDAARLIAAAR
ncbi:MAG: alpha/beta hydrolase domain-containing protein, partial [Acidobacteria bacterium]|nr:alpha/beta hydrolase domain-containing protein [Acidobacteriota bacterium]